MFRRFTLALVVFAIACGGKIDPSATDRTSTKQVGDGPNSTRPGSSSSSSSGGASTGPCSSAPLIPFTEDFDDGEKLGDSFTVSSPSAFSFEYDDPIDGATSLRVQTDKVSYLARKASSVCAARLDFTIRASAQLLTSGTTLARINAGSRRFTIALETGTGSVSIKEEIYTTDAVGLASGQPLGALIADDPTKMFLDVDLTSKKVTAGFSSAKGAAPTRVTDMLQPNATLQAPAAITSVEIGTTPGFAVDPHGVYWLDDIEIE